MAHEEASSPLISNGLRAVLTLILLVALGLLAFRPWARFAEPLPASGSPDRFSAERALEDLRWIAQKPRPLGSEHHALVRERLVEALEAHGLTVDRQSATVVRRLPRGGPVLTGAVENIVARLPGGGKQPAILLMAHYDSVPHSPGASDDGSGVAAILEVIRALRAGGELEHELLVLFSDGEEMGLLGATAFVEEHPWAERAGVTLNLEARGSSGPALMFRTGAANAWLVERFASSSPAPRATSLGYEVFRFLPNDTDLAVFTRAGMEGMDFAFIGDHPRYHSARDSVENLDPASLQHVGEQVLGMVRALDREALDGLPRGNAVYFNLVGDVLVSYPAAWALPLAGALVLAWLLLAILAVRSGLAGAGAIFKGALGVLVAAVVAAGAGVLAWQQISRLDADFRGLPRALSYEAGAYNGAFLLLAAAGAAFVILPLIRVLGGAGVLLGTTLLATVLAVATALYVPGTSYIFLWPTAAGLGLLAFLVVSRSRKGADTPRDSWIAWGAGVLAAAPTVLLWTPLVFLLLGALGLPLAWAAMPLAALALGLSAVALEPVAAAPPAGRGGLLLAAAGLVAALGIFFLGVRSDSFDEDHPRADSLFYCLDPERELARWGSADPVVRPWMETLLDGEREEGALDWCIEPPWNGVFLSTEAPVVPLEGPEIELLRRDQDDDGVFRMAVSVRSRRPAGQLLVSVESLATVEAVSVNGRREDLSASPIGGDGESAPLVIFFGDGPQGFQVELELNQPQAVEFQVVDRSPGLPAEAPRRPADTMPLPFRWESDSTLVRSSKFF